MIKKLSRGAIVASLLVLAACAGQKEPATTAMAAAESALAAVKDDAAKYLPEELHAAEGTLASLKNSLEKGDYKAVMAGAPAPSVPAIRVTRTVLAVQSARSTIRSVRVLATGVGIVTPRAATSSYGMPYT